MSAVSNKPLLVACMPAYDEERTIGGVVVRAMRYVDKVVVCDDGSGDLTGEIAVGLGAEVVRHESGVSKAQSLALAKLAGKIRNLRDHGLQEGASTRLLIYAGRLIKQGIAPRLACKSAIVWTLTDDHEVQKSVEEVVSSIFE